MSKGCCVWDGEGHEEGLMLDGAEAARGEGHGWRAEWSSIGEARNCINRTDPLDISLKISIYSDTRPGERGAGPITWGCGQRRAVQTGGVFLRV